MVDMVTQISLDPQPKPNHDVGTYKPFWLFKFISTISFFFHMDAFLAYVSINSYQCQEQNHDYQLSQFYVYKVIFQ